MQRHLRSRLVLLGFPSTDTTTADGNTHYQEPVLSSQAIIPVWSTETLELRDRGMPTSHRQCVGKLSAVGRHTLRILAVQKSVTDSQHLSVTDFQHSCQVLRRHESPQQSPQQPLLYLQVSRCPRQMLQPSAFPEGTSVPGYVCQLSCRVLMGGASSTQVCQIV